MVVVPFHQQHICKIQLLQQFLYLFEIPCKLPAEDTTFGTVWVFLKPVEMPDIQRSVDANLGTALVSLQLCNLPNPVPVQAFAIRLVEMFH
ncbi:hypothetical protein TNCV_2797291 [Trichonephila clavipes]|nr:hypothetical protein TNCV_2797291 [Trichonephila clavipes]